MLNLGLDVHSLVTSWGCSSSWGPWRQCQVATESSFFTFLPFLNVNVKSERVATGKVKEVMLDSKVFKALRAYGFICWAVQYVPETVRQLTVFHFPVISNC